MLGYYHGSSFRPNSYHLTRPRPRGPFNTPSHAPRSVALDPLRHASIISLLPAERASACLPPTTHCHFVLPTHKLSYISYFYQNVCVLSVCCSLFCFCFCLFFIFSLTWHCNKIAITVIDKASVCPPPSPPCNYALD